MAGARKEANNMGPVNQTPNRYRKGANTFIGFTLCLLAIFGYFLLLNLALKMAFIGANWSSFHAEGLIRIARALFLGLRFDISISTYLFLPAIILYWTIVLTRGRFLKWILEGYFVATAIVILILWLADLQYFEAAGKHFTYEAFVYLGTSLLPMLSGAFKLHPWLSALSILIIIGFSFVTDQVIRRCMRRFIPAPPIRASYLISSLIILLMLEFLGARGGIQRLPLSIGNSCISPSPYLNALCLNPVYSTLRTMASSSSKPQFKFFDETSNLNTVRDLLGKGESEFTSSAYPLLRNSPGTEKGNGKNIVIFVLENWAAKDIGCLGNKVKVTPVFDDLSRQGILFTNFFATGLRTAEGIFSILCSFPNQPLLPIMARSTIYQTHWRSLSRILGEAGYYNIFIHGRDLGFDHMGQFLGYIYFHKIIDRHDFPHSKSSLSDSWPGYNDEEVMRRADEEFSAHTSHPFFGVIYTMNTHEPFMTPEGFPLTFPPSTPSNRFFNSLRYADQTLETFFNIARTKPYFKNTIFLFVADHTRTGEKLNFFDQHHIPLLIYSPGYIRPCINPVVGSQLDLLPTILDLLQLKTQHASWGRNLLELPQDQGFAISVAGNEVRWHDSRYLLNDSLIEGPMLMFDIIHDSNCTTDIWRHHQEEGEILKKRIRSCISLSQTLLYQNRVYPPSSMALHNSAIRN